MKELIKKYGVSEIEFFLNRCHENGFSSSELNTVNEMIEFFNTIQDAPATLVFIESGKAWDYETMARYKKTYLGETVVKTCVPGFTHKGVLLVKPRVTTI